jgi:hypothetical protein
MRTVTPSPANAEGIPSVYTNNVQFSLSPIDVRLLFNEIIMDQGGPRAERRANVVMSIEHFKAFAEVINSGLRQALQHESQTEDLKRETPKGE